jgi:hypothetical protein
LWLHIERERLVPDKAVLSSVGEEAAQAVGSQMGDEEMSRQRDCPGLHASASLSRHLDVCAAQKRLKQREPVDSKPLLDPRSLVLVAAARAKQTVGPNPYLVRAFRPAVE